ncbi:SCO family protein [Paracoccus aerodenitrificans]|uniref:SCO family protein n=1 Tax=Paracoccus aerodenitrificans TaxID=3017781 RepID=UPI0022F040E5|nr:SCO family protein [Paracoccus aerodenitrificans]WBU63809.1 SCO family protein [Paracoccus aerodenitrificans]
MTDKKLLIVGALASVLLLVLGWLWLGRADNAATQTALGDGQDAFSQCREGVIAGGAGSIGGPFEMTDENGNRVTDADIITKPTLIYFGFSFCPDVCPLDNSRNAEALDLLEEDGIDAQAVFVTVDPKRDTPEVMNDYTANMHEKMIGLTGSEEDIAAMAKTWRVAYIVNDDGSDDYTVSHTTQTYLSLPEAGFVEFFNRDISAEEMAERVGCFVNAS